jgi:ribosomal protein L17
MSEELSRITKLAGISEGLSGTAKSSFENLDKTKLIIRHKGKVDETVPGARSRQIQSLYIENEDGERFKYPLTHLAGARAMTRHVANGGKPYDEFGKHIIQTSEDIAKLNSFSRYVTNKDQLNDNAGDIIEQTKMKLENLRNYVRNLSKQSHYEEASKNFKTSDEVVLDDETVNKLREKFTMKNLDNRVEDALPIINKIMSELEATQEKPIEEYKDKDGNDMEPIDAPIQPPVDHGAIVQGFLTDPDSKLILRKDDTADKMLSRTKFTNKNTMLSSILSDIASRLLTKSGEEDRVANFASRVADEMEQENSATFKPTPDYIKNKKIAVQLAKRYIDDYKKMQSDPAYKDEIRMEPGAFNPKKDLKGKAKETEAFESWVDNITEQKPYVSMYKDDKGKMVYDVLDKDGKSAFKSSEEKVATDYLHKNFDKLKEGNVEEYAKEPKDEKDKAEKLKAIHDLEMDPKLKDPESIEAIKKRKAELMKSEDAGEKIANMAQNMTRDEFMSHADELGLTPEEAAEHYEKMSGGAHAGKFEGNQFAQAVNKAKAAGMKSGDKFKVGDKEYTLKDAIELAGLDLNEFYSEDELATEQQIERIKELSIYQ